MFTNITLLFVMLLFPLAGFIAWAGDRIGHRTGKKRHTLFGLRPRHTATLFTVGAGVLIVAVSFGTFWLSSESFRMVVQQGETLYRNNLRLKKENQEQGNAIAAARLQEDNIRQEADQFNAERLQAEEARTEALAGLEAAKKRQEEAEKRALEAQGNYKQAVVRLTTAQEDLRRARADLGDVQAQLRGKTERIRVAESQIVAAEGRRKAAEARVRLAEQKVQIAEGEQRKAQQDATEARRTAVQLVQHADEQRKAVEADLTKKTENLRGQLNEQKELYAKLQKQTDTQRTELAHLTGELEQKRREYAQVAASTLALRGKQITYQVGEEVDRIAIRSGYNIWRVQAILSSFLTTAGKKAESRGAFRDRDSRAVIIPAVALPGDLALAGPSGGGVKLFTEDDALAAAASAIRRRNEDVLVVATALANAVAGEPVAIKLEIYRNPVVLEQDEKLAEITVNGEGSRQEVADAIYNFLRRDVHQRLVAAGMIPIAKGGDSSSDGTETPRLAEFTLSGEEWLELMDHVRNSGPRAKIIAYAAKALRAGDPVSLRFEVKGHPSPPPVQTAPDHWP